MTEARIIDGVEFFNDDDGDCECDADAQCARCGSSVTWSDCWDCGGEGFVTIAEDDMTEGEDTCDTCDGNGGWYTCLSSAAWCEAHPLEGRSEQKGAGAL